MELRKDSGLNVTMSGSAGTFSVGGSTGNKSSIEVKYFLSHVSLDFTSGSNESILSNIAPVREIFDFDELTFDELMQRDLDDARVSSELIPYLLDTDSRDLVKLFPPIIIAVLPVHTDANRPASYYPEVEKIEEEEIIGRDDDGKPKTQKYKKLRAGSKGEEVFQFEQPVQENGEVLDHDLVRFKVNDNRARMVIVDGQHRAMALLALYRNLKNEWSGQGEDKYKGYYSQWTKSQIREFDIGEISLPMMICTFPELDKTYNGDFDLKNAAREIFLTLNKTARKVSETRNILLDDNDVIASFLRSVLENIKERNINSNYSLRIHNVELDQAQDRIKLKDPVAVTGVNHIYYAIQHLMLNEPESDVKGIKSRSGRFKARTNLSSYNTLQRLSAYDDLGADVANSIDRKRYSKSTEEKLNNSFCKKYGKYVVKMFEEVEVYECHNRASLKKKRELDEHQDRRVKPILYEGQGIERNFKRHKNNIKEQIEENYFGDQSPEVKEVLRSLESTQERVKKAVEDLERYRTEEYLKDIEEDKIADSKGDIYRSIKKWVNKTYKNTFKSVAFQTSIICTFFDQIERAYPPQENQDIEIEALFEEYIKIINNFFRPSTSEKLGDLMSLLDGEPDKDDDWKIKPTPNTFDNVVSPRSMNPDKWTHYRYLILEIWTTDDDEINNEIKKSVRKCRKQTLQKLYDRNKSDYCEENKKYPDDLSKSEKINIANESAGQISEFLSLLGSKIDDNSSFVEDNLGLESQ